MKFTSGVRHPPFAAAATKDFEPQHRPPAPRPPRVRPRLAAPRPAAGGRPAAAMQARRLTALSVVACAALWGCSSLPTWRVEPAFRIESGGANPGPGLVALAQQYEGEGRVEQALQAYAKAAQAAPTDAELHNTVGLALARHGRFGAAVTALRRAVALAPERAPLLNNLAYALLLDGRAEDARAMLRLTLAVDPSHPMASRNLAYVDQQLASAAATAAAPIVAAEKAPAAAPVSVATVAPVAALPAQEVPSQPAPPAQSIVADSAAPPSAPSTTANPAAPAPRWQNSVSIEIINGNGVSGAAARLQLRLREQGIQASRLANLPPYRSAYTQVLYRPGKAEQARLVVQRMPVDAEVLPAPAGSTRADLRVVIGHDARHAAGCTLLAVCAVPERWASAVDSRRLKPAADSGDSHRVD